jgi:eukaryotic-like serine/threonine-protein kinase
MNNPQHDPLGIVGTTVAEKYQIQAVAGEGGFSTVYRAEHLIWKQPVAIKFFNILEDADPDMREQLLNDFIQEGKLMSELSSKSAAIVQARDIGKLAMPGGNWIPYMVLEWLDGTPLDIVLKREQTARMHARTLEQALVLLEPAAIALDVAHGQNVAHRDLKPANIMIMGDPRAPDASVKVMDFGIAKVMADREALQQQLQLTGHQITAFTPNHGAPEQFSRHYGATGPWTDVFAMALILVEVLRGGQRALDGESFFELGVSSCDPNRRPTPLTVGVPVSPQVDAVFRRALAVSPSDRYPTMGVFWSELFALVYPGQPTWRSIRRGDTKTGPPTSLLSSPMPSIPAQMSMGPTTAMGVATPQRDPTNKTTVVAATLVGVLAVGGAATAIALFGSGGEAKETKEAASSASASAAPPASASAPAAPAIEWDGPCPKGMKVVNGGTFKMGSDEDSFKAWKPAHDVTLDTYCLAVNETTMGEYAACEKAGKCKAAGTKVDFPKQGDTPDEDHQRALAAYSEFCNAGKPDRDSHPVNCVDWFAAEAYCAWRSFRLPTEAEWELAARGTDGRKFPWGNDSGDQTYMNAAGTEWQRWLEEKKLPPPSGLMYEADDTFIGTAPVGRFPRAMTQTGQMDMVGNVWEWTQDWYAVYKPEAQTNPKGPITGPSKAIRGGGFNGEFSVWVNPAARYFQVPNAVVHAVGFRCASNVRQQ